MTGSGHDSDSTADDREPRAHGNSVPQPSDLEREAHAYARKQGFSLPVYRAVVLAGTIVLRLGFRVRMLGSDQIPRDGAAIVAPNHKNFFDVFFIAMATRRPVRYMAKVELFKGPLRWLFPRVGTFPVRRGEADGEALQTARMILADGWLVVMFPEGTRVEEPGVLGSPHHGAGRLALQTGAPIIPAAITGTSHLWRGAVPKTKRVQLAFLPAITSQPALGDQNSASQLIDAQVWPAVQEKYGSLRATPGLIAACLAAIGVGGGLFAKRHRASRRKPDLVGTVEPRKDRRRGRKSRS